MNSSFVPDNKIVPKGINTDLFNLRMLTVNDLIKDYDAVMSSANHLKGIFGPHDDWPNELTLEENLVDLGWHQKEFEIKSSFAFTVTSIDDTKCLGCVYINPSHKLHFDAEIILWIRESEKLTKLDADLFSTVKEWIRSDWWFEKVAYPGREITWRTWEDLPLK